MKNLFQKVPRLVLAVIGLAVFGLVRAPFEDDLRGRLVETRLLLPPPAKGAFEQMSQSEIATALRCSVKAVEVRVYRARQMLRQMLDTSL